MPPETKYIRDEIRWQKLVFAEEVGPSQMLSEMATIKELRNNYTSFCFALLKLVIYTDLNYL